ncbi:MAG TPA: four helix bundle protein [Gemmatimonadaceae bacterium]|jgi:four helix bundle protein|nr:four helix bundle protein [Gemmatimonadaceae bacterium]
MQDFKKLRVWAQAHAFSLNVRGATRRCPRALESLKSQLVRSASSISGTITEGCGADSAKEFARFLQMAIKSASETEYHLLDARDNGLITRQRWRALNADVCSIRAQVIVLRRRVLGANR